MTSFGEALGAFMHRLHIFSGAKARAPGVASRWTQNLSPVGTRVISGGDLVELVAVLDSRFDISAASVVRFDILEEDFLFFGGLDDQVISLLGTGATAPGGFTSQQQTTQFHVLTADDTLESFVRDFRLQHPADFERFVLVVRDAVTGPLGPPPPPPDPDRQSYLITWWRAQQVEDIGDRSEMYFNAVVEGLPEDAPVQTLQVQKAAPGVAVRIRGRLLDQRPFVADGRHPEPLDDITVSLSDQQTQSGTSGTWVIDARLPLGMHELRVSRDGIDAVVHRVEVTADAAGLVTATLRHTAGGAPVVASTNAVPDETTRLELALADTAVLVHKIRGTVEWPDSRPVPMPAGYAGTPVSGKRVYVLTLPAGAAPDAYRPKSSLQWQEMKDRPGVVRSGRPGQAARHQRTDTDGRFEVKYVDLTPGRSHLVWVESRSPSDPPGTDMDSHEYVVHTLRRPIIELVGPGPGLPAATAANNTGAADRLLIDHTYNLTTDRMAWGVEPIRIAQWQPDPAAPDPAVNDPRLLRPQLDRGPGVAWSAAQAKMDYEREPTGTGRFVQTTAVPATKTIEGFALQVLPLIPVFEPPDVRSVSAAVAATGVAEGADAAYAMGHFASDVPWVLDAARIGIDVSVGVWEAAGNAARTVELLEKTFMVTAQRGLAPHPPTGDARWRCDSVSLADLAFISIPAAGPNAQVVAGRSLDSTWIPVLMAAAPRLVTLSARKHLLLGPGHGLWPSNNNETSPALAQWVSDRGGWSGRAGEDDVDAYLAREVDRICTRQGLLVTPTREIRNLMTPGLYHRANNDFRTCPTVDFPRLWQQNAIYHFANQGDPLVVTVPPAAVTIFGQTATPDPPPGNPPNTKNSQGVRLRAAIARRLAAQAVRPIDTFLAPHTNSAGAAERSTYTLYLEVAVSEFNAANFNTMGRSFATRLNAQLLARCHIPAVRGGVVTMQAEMNMSDSDMVNTFDHYRLEDPAVPPVRQRRVAARPASVPLGANNGPGPTAGTTWRYQPFPRRISVALPEAGYHTSAADAALNSCAWFRRLSGEAMAMAVAVQLGDETAREMDLADIMMRTFGSTDAVRQLAAGNAALGAGAIIQPFQQVTGTVVPPGNSTLADIATAVSIAADASTRQMFLTELIARLRVIAGYQAADDDAVESFIAAAILNGPSAGLRRPAAPLTRADAASLLARGIGLVPATLDSVMNNRFGVGAGTPLLPALHGGEVADALLSRLDADATLDRVDALQPGDVYHAVEVVIADPRGRRPLNSQPYRLTNGQPVVFIARTAGAPFKAAASDVRFTIKSSACFDSRVDGAARFSRRLRSEIWDVNLPVSNAPADVQVEVSVRHPAAGWTRIGLQHLKLQVSPQV